MNTSNMNSTTNTTRYFDLSNSQKLALSHEDLQRAIEIEAAERGLAIPIKLDEKLHESEFKYLSYQIPSDAAVFYEIVTPSGYSGRSESGVFFRTMEEAERALAGACRITEEGYGSDKKLKITQGDFSIQKRWMTLRKGESMGKALEDFEQDTQPFKDLIDEVHEDLSAIRQAEYNAAVKKAKRDKFLELANGSEDIARRFWANSERDEWPEVIHEDEAVPA